VEATIFPSEAHSSEALPARTPLILINHAPPIEGKKRRIRTSRLSMVTKLVHHTRSPWFWFLLFLLLATAFLLSIATPAARLLLPSRLLSPFSETVPELLADPLFIGMNVDGRLSRDVQLFYHGRNYEPAWLGNEPDEGLVRGALSQAAEHGLDAADYVFPDLPAGAGVEESARYELGLTAAVLRYASDLRRGRLTPQEVYRDADLPREDFEASVALRTAVSQERLGAFLSELAPPQAEYAALRRALRSYRGITITGGWPLVPPRAEIRNGDAAWDVLRQRLAFEDSVLAAATEQADIDLVAALQRYQRRNGLEPDGRLGPKTLATLNVSAAERVEQIIANMERWRWMPRNPERRQILVNAADASLILRDGEEALLHSRVVVGAANTPTPIFRAVATGVTVNPPWNVPASIARNEILPKLKRDAAYLEKNDMVLVDGPAGDPSGRTINWRTIPAGSFPYRIRQRPGPKNPLGVAKLEMQSSFDVYLHDTPGKTAFARNERNLSHGCIRVEQILPLASLALSGLGMPDPEGLAASIAGGETQTLPLPAPLAVYVVYWTVLAQPDGTVHFRPDIYQRDRFITAALAARAAREPFPFYAGGCTTTFG
jgi:murein L,D-transpeptidase YcbB/YkuD